MLLNYDFLELVDEPQRNTSLTSAIDKALADKKLARQNKPRVRIKGGLSLRETLDAFGDELSRLKNSQNTETIKGSTIESANLNSIVNKIKSGLPFGTISAFRPFKDAFIKDFTEKEQKALIYAYKSGYIKADADKITQYWQNKPTKIDLHKPIKAKDFFKGNTNIYRTLRNLFGQKFMDRYTAINSEATMKDFMSSDKFVKKYRFTEKDNMKRTRQLKSLLDSKRDFLGYIQVIGYWKEDLNDDLIPDKETSFFVFSNEPSSTFDLASYLLLLARLFNQAAICYCDNAKTDKVELVSALPNDFGLDLQRCTMSKSFKASYNHNIKVNNLVKALRQGKEVSKTLIAKVLANTIDTDAGYCFISPTDLVTQLNNISPRVSKSIVTAIEQAERVRLTYALIDKITYNSLHNILNFIFDIDNPLSDQDLEELVVEVPKEALKNVKLPQIKNVLTAQIFEGSYQLKN
ncbi:hypothetical protein HpRN173_06540 [Helicobacter pylori]